MRGRGLRSAAGAAVALAVVSVAGWAFACTAQPTMIVASQAVARPGASVVVTGEVLEPAPVEVRWDAVGGPVVAPPTVPSGRSYTVPVAVPADATPGPHVLVLMSGGRHVARTVVEVTPVDAPSPARAASLWPSADTAEPAAEPAAGRSSPLLPGAAFLVVGLVALSGYALVAMRRSRVPARRRISD